ncbi:MAG TPA: hypothetical protein VGM81_00425 [Burkholderiaceae bacterium]|jgi:hypothetical protein
MQYSVLDGPSNNVMFREGQTCAQFVLMNGPAPRLLFAFAAGNSGAALWFDAAPVNWQLSAPLQAKQLNDAQGRVLHGVEAEVAADCSRLRIKSALVGSIRVLRDHQHDGRLPPAGCVEPTITSTANGTTMTWARDRIDGAPGYWMQMQVVDGHVEGMDLIAPPGRPLVLKLIACTGETPLRLLEARNLLNDKAAPAASAARRALEFLSFEDRFLAGGWRFLTYFGRDTLMSLRMLLPVLQPAAIEAALMSVLDRLDAQGRVAHEENVGEFPLIERLAAGLPIVDAPAVDLDYKMVDDDFMLLPVLAGCLLETGDRQAAADFLARPGASSISSTGPSGIPYGALVARNAALVLDKARPFGQQPVARHLIPIEPGQAVGDWRDSQEGLAGGTFSYSVNAVLVPAALEALQALLDSGLLDAHLDAIGPHDDLASLTRVWQREAPTCFLFARSNSAVQVAVSAYALELNLPPARVQSAMQDLAATETLVSSALALDAHGRPLPILHSDFAFALLLGRPDPATLQREVAQMLRPFPAGLMTEAGMLVANPVFGDAAQRDMFANDRYHGTVVWSWHHAMAAAGLARQLEREDLDAATRDGLLDAERRLWQCIHATREVASSELWSWRYDGQRFVVAPYGPQSKTADESNAAQLWSTVFIAVQAPHR